MPARPVHHFHQSMFRAAALNQGRLGNRTIQSMQVSPCMSAQTEGPCTLIRLPTARFKLHTCCYQLPEGMNLSPAMLTVQRNDSVQLSMGQRALWLSWAGTHSGPPLRPHPLLALQLLLVEGLPRLLTLLQQDLAMCPGGAWGTPWGLTEQQWGPTDHHSLSGCCAAQPQGTHPCLHLHSNTCHSSGMLPKI